MPRLVREGRKDDASNRDCQADKAEDAPMFWKPRDSRSYCDCCHVQKAGLKGRRQREDGGGRLLREELRRPVRVEDTDTVKGLQDQTERNLNW